MTIPKFRAWDVESKKMTRWEDLILEKDDRQDYFSIGYKATEILTKFDHEQILMQSTGLTDKNGQEIFEGDVVICYDEQDEYGPYPCQIFFCEDNLAWSLKELPTEDKYTMSEYGWDEIEVIGNIYENPELVEVENE